jgi:hypothetical protein
VLCKRGIAAGQPTATKKGGLRESPPSFVLIFFAQGPGDIPTPPRARTKLFDRLCNHLVSPESIFR